MGQFAALRSLLGFADPSALTDAGRKATELLLRETEHAHKLLREQKLELDAVLDKRDQNRRAAVTICAIAGTAGVGKTALAVHWAHRVRERFPDGQLYVNLRGYASDSPVRQCCGPCRARLIATTDSSSGTASFARCVFTSTRPSPMRAGITTSC